MSDDAGVSDRTGMSDQTGTRHHGGPVMLVVLALVAAVLSPLAATGVAQAATTGYIKAPWSPIIYAVDEDGSRDALTYPEWVSLGAPRPTVAPATYVKVSWSPSVYGLVTWPDSSVTTDDAHLLTWPEYSGLGRPAITTVAHIPGTKYFRWTSDGAEIFARTPDTTVRKLTYPQWRAAGHPSPELATRGFYRAAWSHVIHEVTTAGRVRQITYPEWIALGAPRAASAPVTYAKTPWAPDVYGLITWPNSPADTRVDQVARLSWVDYVAAGRPALVARTRIPGDSFVKYTVGPTVFHSVQGVLTPLTAADWRAAGTPPPATVVAPAPAYIRGVLVVNKSLPIPSWFGGGLAPELSSAFAAMRGAAASSGLNLYISSGYRSFATQQSLYNRFVGSEGVVVADTHSARPGHSEHQTGLAIDVNTVAPSFAYSAEGRWVAANAHLFGFVIRYPAGKEPITGYMYEPWHLRYVGPELATLLHRSNLTIEEYMMVPSRY